MISTRKLSPILAVLFWVITLPELFAGISVVGSLERKHKVNPGDSYEGIISVKNSSNEVGEVRIYQTDYQFFSDGRSLYDQPGSHPRSNADWFSVRPSRILIAPNETVSVSYKGTVPKETSLHGTYWSIIMIEPIIKAAPLLDPPRRDSLTLNTQIRYGIQMVTDVGDNAHPELKLINRQLISNNGKWKLALDLENVGQWGLTPEVWLELFNLQGLSMGKFEGNRSRIYPTCSVHHDIELNNVPPGRYTALVIVDSGEEQVMGAQYELVLQP